MIVTFEVPDEILSSIEEHLKTQIRVETDDLTGAQRHIRVHEDPTAWFMDIVGQACHQIVQRFPTPEMREHMKAEQKARDAIRAAVSPRRVGRELADPK
jgi:hypothetical protein